MTDPIEILDPDLPIADAHHHVWDLPQGRYLFDDLHTDLTSGHAIRRTVFVQCGAMLRATGPEELRTLGETEFANGIGAMYASGLYGDTRACCGIVAQVDLTRAAAAGPVLDRHIAVAPDRLRGVRHITAWDADARFLNPRNIVRPGMMAEPAFRAGLAEVAARGLVFDAWLLFHQIDELADLADAFPEVPFVLNHMGGPLGAGAYAGRRDAVFRDWRTALARLGRRSNVALKIGGLGMPACGFGFDGRDPPASYREIAAAWAPHVLTGIEIFGPSRCMFESNYPVDRITCSYATLWNAFKHITQGFSGADRAALFHDTATRIYRLEDAP